jgi:aminoglycoside phosphotransferase (APT) family kinase protein
MLMADDLAVAERLLSDAGLPNVKAWIESTLGGVVLTMERQSRWRPIYFVDLERDGVTHRLCVRGDRTDVPCVFPLEHEMLVQRLMHEHGVNVPRVYGWIDDPRCYVMDWVEGVADFGGASEAQRRAVMTDYMKLLAELHKVPVQPFKDAGVVHAREPSQSHLVGAERYENIIYRGTKKRPDPFIEWVLCWWRRHPLKPHAREAVVTWDSGQFHQKDGRLVAMIDIELGHVGDPMMDLAAFRMRDTVLHYGDIGELYKIYEEHAGAPIDLDAIKWHHLFFTLSNALSFNTALADPTPESDYMTNLQWVNETNRFALEAIAEYLDVDLPEVAMPEPEPTQVATPFEHMVRSLTRVDAGDPFAQHQVRILFRLARHLQRWDQVGRAMEQATFDDVEALLGRRPADWEESEQMLEDFVLQDDGRHDRELIALFNRKLQRAQSLNGPVGSAMSRHNPIQRFDGKTW